VLSSIVLAIGLACVPVDVVPQKWNAALTAARPGGHDALLDQLGMRGVTNVAWLPPKLLRVRLVPAKFGGKGDLLVEAVFTTQFTDVKAEERGKELSREVRLYRVQALRGDGRKWCALGSELSDDVPRESPNAGPVDGMKDLALDREFSLVHFTSATRHSVRVDKPFDTVSRASAKGTRVEWWDVAGDRLTLTDAHDQSVTTCGACESPYARTWFELQGQPPVKVVQHTRACTDATEKTCTTE
jgi:hypothetical protein